MVRAAAGTATFGVALTLYWLIPAMDALPAQRSPVTRLDVGVPDGGSGLWGLILDVAGLSGCGAVSPLVINHLSGWPFLLLANTCGRRAWPF